MYHVIVSPFTMPMLPRCCSPVVALGAIRMGLLHFHMEVIGGDWAWL